MTPRYFALFKKTIILSNFKEENLVYCQILRVNNLYNYTDKISTSDRSEYSTVALLASCFE